MTTHIRFRRGFKNDLPSYAPSGMPMWCEDTQELYLGTGTGLVQVGGKTMVSANGKQPFEIFYSMSTETPAGAYPLWTGELIPNCGELLPDFWNKALELSKDKDVTVALLKAMTESTNEDYVVEDLMDTESSSKSSQAIADPYSYTFFSNIILAFISYF